MLVLNLAIVVVCVWLMLHKPNIIAAFERQDDIRFDNKVWRVAGAVVFAAILFLIPYIKFKYNIGQDIKNPVYDPTLLLLFYYWACWWMILLAVTALKAALQTSWLGSFVSASILLGVAYEILSRFNVVNTYPFSLGWSEGSRYYYASLPFSKALYGEAFPLSPYHASRYLLQSIPFLIPGFGMFEHRLWQFLLWILLTTGASFALANRVIEPNKKWFRLLFAAWLFLFFLRVGVYYHLQVIVILTVLGVLVKRPWTSLLVVILASAWAGISRVNWFVMPAMMAITMYVLETPLSKTKFSVKQFFSYFYYPIVWSIGGLLSAFAAQTAYVFLSGNADNARAFTSSFTSDLLWYRLLPNESYSLGIIVGILIVSGPLLAGFILVSKRNSKSIHAIRWSVVWLIVVGLFVGSMIVSVKIGGGGDLHNTDTYSVLLSIVVAYFIGNKVKPDSGQVDDWQVLKPPIVLVAVVIPLLFLIPGLSPYPKFREGLSQAAHQQIVDVVSDAGRDGQVLFISERQMVTFDEVSVPLVSDYELIILMEMAMSGNQAYLDRFYADLKDKRFAAIVAGKQNLGIKEDGALYEENNAWNSSVSPYILCYYEPTQTIDAELKKIQIFTPRLVPECNP